MNKRHRHITKGLENVFLVTETSNCLADGIKDDQTVTLVTSRAWRELKTKQELADFVREQDGLPGIWFETGPSLTGAAHEQCMDITVKRMAERYD